MKHKDILLWIISGLRQIFEHIEETDDDLEFVTKFDQLLIRLEVLCKCL